MAVQLTVTLDKPNLLGDLAAAHEDMSDLLEVVGVTQMAGMADQLERTYSMHPQAFRSGDLYRSLNVGGRSDVGSANTIFQVDKLAMLVGSSVEYAAAQSEGATIKPRTVKFLAIPIPRKLKVSKKWPRDFPKGALEFRPGKKHGLLFDANDGELGYGKGPLYVLVRQTIIPAKGMTEAAERAVELEIDDIYKEWIDRHASGGRA